MAIEVERPGSPRATSPGTIEIGLLNLLSDAALKSCERQIVDLVEAASGAASVRLRLFSLPGVARSGTAQKRMAATYHDLDALLATRLDGLFVTGAEPSAERLSDEPFWPQLTDVIDWARSNTRSAIWSCLAAHAAVLHLDGIERHRRPEKCWGSFVVEPAGDSSLVTGTREARVYHSRWNDVREDDLLAADYRIQTRGRIGADIFLKDCGSRFVFLQGHPEYDAGALGREYRRDVQRFLSGAREDYPMLPVDYFSDPIADALRRFQNEVRRAPRPDLIEHYPIVGEAAHTPSVHRAFAEMLFGNWLGFIAPADVDNAAA